MNTKSFVNGLDPDNTVKGYYDENDKLVMAEPEGSGGGGSYTTKYENEAAQFTWNTSEERAVLNVGALDTKKVYKITIDTDIIYFVTFSHNNTHDVRSRVIPHDTDPGGNEVDLDGVGTLGVSGNTAETWAAATHNVKVEEMCY